MSFAGEMILRRNYVTDITYILSCTFPASICGMGDTCFNTCRRRDGVFVTSLLVINIGTSDSECNNYQYVAVNLFFVVVVIIAASVIDADDDEEGEDDDDDDDDENDDDDEEEEGNNDDELKY